MQISGILDRRLLFASNRRGSLCPVKERFSRADTGKNPAHSGFGGHPILHPIRGRSCRRAPVASPGARFGLLARPRQPCGIVDFQRVLSGSSERRGRLRKSRFGGSKCRYPLSKPGAFVSLWHRFDVLRAGLAGFLACRARGTISHDFRCCRTSPACGLIRALSADHWSFLPLCGR